MNVLDENNKPKNITPFIWGAVCTIAGIAWLIIWFIIEWEFIQEINSADYAGTYTRNEVLFRALRHLLPALILVVAGHLFYRSWAKKT